MLENYMFTDDKLKSFASFAKLKEKEEKVLIPKKEKETKRAFNDTDTLFWCYYEMKNGVGSYDQIEKKTIVTEKQMKIALVERLRESTLLHKFAAVTHIESKLANDKTIDIMTFLTLCVLDELNVIFVNKRTYYELMLNADRPIHCIYKMDYKYGMDLIPDLANIRDTFYKVDNIDKPIKAVSAYKLDELVDMYKRVSGGDESVKKKKADLYQAIVFAVKN